MSIFLMKQPSKINFQSQAVVFVNLASHFRPRDIKNKQTEMKKDANSVRGIGEKTGSLMRNDRRDPWFAYFTPLCVFFLALKQ